MLSFFTFLQGQHLSPWQSLRGESFVVLYQQMDSLNAQNIYKILSEDFYSINYEIGATLEQPVRIFIAPTESGFTRMTGESFPHWGKLWQFLHINRLLSNRHAGTDRASK